MYWKNNRDHDSFYECTECNKEQVLVGDPNLEKTVCIHCKSIPNLSRSQYIHDIIEDINHLIFTRLDSLYSDPHNFFLNYVYDGYSDYIMFLNICIWDSSDESERYNEYAEEYTPLKKFLLYKINEVIEASVKIL